ncbi:MAG TPA: thiamine phosphate synthase [Silvibacterium sp.]|nr:thiamine phosphate synthase [Silvibacterium sp.]
MNLWCSISQPNSGYLSVSTVYSLKMLLYAITCRRLLPGSEQERQATLVALARDWVLGGVDYIQVREKDLPPADLLALTCQIVAAVRREERQTRVMLNGPAAIALEAEADGVHLPGHAPPAAVEAARRLYRSGGREAVVSRACHSADEVRAARDASLIVFAPVFEKASEQNDSGKKTLPGLGLAALSEACRSAKPVPVLALGGVTRENARACVDAGAAGIAAIRLFLGEDWRQLR